MNAAQKRYTTGEQELLSIVETLKEFRNILLGQQIVVYTDHKNLMYKTYNSERSMRWRLIIGEFSPDIQYINGTKNSTTDALSLLEYDNNQNMEEVSFESLAIENSKYILGNKIAMPINF